MLSVVNILEAWSGGEANRQAKACVEIHLDGEKYWHCTRPNDSGAWNYSSEPLLLLAKERCLGRAQGVTGEQALDISKANDHSSQPSYRYHQFVAAEWWKLSVILNV